MVSNKNEKLLPNYYQQSLYRQVKSLKQKDLCLGVYKWIPQTTTQIRT